MLRVYFVLCVLYKIEKLLAERPENKLPIYLFISISTGATPKAKSHKIGTSRAALKHVKKAKGVQEEV